METSKGNGNFYCLCGTFRPRASACLSISKVLHLVARSSFWWPSNACNCKVQVKMRAKKVANAKNNFKQKDPWTGKNWMKKQSLNTFKHVFLGLYPEFTLCRRVNRFFKIFFRTQPASLLGVYEVKTVLKINEIRVLLIRSHGLTTKREIHAANFAKQIEHFLCSLVELPVPAEAEKERSSWLLE